MISNNSLMVPGNSWYNIARTLRPKPRNLEPRLATTLFCLLGLLNAKPYALFRGPVRRRVIQCTASSATGRRGPAPQSGANTCDDLVRALGLGLMLLNCHVRIDISSSPSHGHLSVSRTPASSLASTSSCPYRRHRGYRHMNSRTTRTSITTTTTSTPASKGQPGVMDLAGCCQPRIFS